MSVIDDAFTAPREELTRIHELRSTAPPRHGDAIEVYGNQKRAELRGSLQDHTPDLTDARGTHELHAPAPRNDSEPHGMYWERRQTGVAVLRPHGWFIKQITSEADSVFVITRDAIAGDQDTIDKYTELGDSLLAYIDSRSQLNEMVRIRKFRQELDDAAYQLCQAAKYKVDAQERARLLVERDGDALDNDQINQLIERAQQAAHEGFVLAYAIRHAGFNEPLNFDTSAKRVLEYSCRRLTEWFAQRRQNADNQQRLSVSATTSIINNMFLRSPPR